MAMRGSRLALCSWAALVCLAAVPALAQASLQPARYHCNGYLVLRLVGSPDDLGRQHGRLAGSLVRRVVKAVITDGEASTPESYRRLIVGTRVMERYLPDEYRRELRALAASARVGYDDLVALQLFGDVQRASRCSSFALYGPATLTGECLVGRNFDYWDHGVTRYAGAILHYVPDRGLPFVTVSWAGVINGWTAMNTRGVVAANNTAYAGTDSLEGLSTCFMIRKIVQNARSVSEGVKIVQQTPRACGTNMLIAGGDPPRAAVVEFDHRDVAVRWADQGAVWATNHFRKLGREAEMGPDEGWCSRYETLAGLIRDNYGRVDRTMNFAAAPGVPLRGINLHSALLFPSDLSFRLSMGRVPAADYLYRGFRLTPAGLVAMP
jgi:hypothetical protein